MAAQVFANLIINTPCLGAIGSESPALLDCHTLSRHQDFLNRVYIGYLMCQRAAGEMAELVYHQPPRPIESSQYIHNHIRENNTLINRHYHYQQMPNVLSVNQQYAERLSSTSRTSSKGRRKSNNNQLAVKALPQLQLKSTLNRLVDNSKLLSLLQVSPAATERQAGMAKLNTNRFEQPKATADSQMAQFAQIVQPLQVLWYSYSGQQVSRFLPLLRQAEQLANNLTAPQKLDAIIERQISRNSLSHLSKLDKQPDDEKSQQQAQVLVSHPLILNTFNEKQQRQNTYLSQLPQRLFAGSLNVNAGTSTNDNSLAQYQYNIQYRSLRQNMPYSVSSALAANIQTSDFNQAGAFRQRGKYSDQQPLSYLQTLNRFSTEQQLHHTHLGRLSVFSSQLQPSVALAARHMSRVYRRLPGSLIQAQTSPEPVKASADILKHVIGDRNEQLSAVPAPQVSPVIKPMPHSRANLVYTTKDKPDRYLLSSTTLPSATSPSSAAKMTDGTIWPVNYSNAKQPSVAVTPEQHDQQLSRRPQSMLSKTQTRLVADEVYQLINQRLRFEKRRRGLVG